MTDSLVDNGKVRRLGVPDPEAAPDFSDVQPSSYAVNDPTFLASTAVIGGNVRKLDDWVPPMVDWTAAAAADPPFRSETPVPDHVSTPIIAIHGDYGAGKSTLAELIRLTYPGSAVLPLADALREAVVRSGVPREKVYEKPTSPEVRALLEAQAKVMTKLQGDDYFAQEWLKTAAQSTATVLIVDDLRRPAELRMLMKQGAMIVSLTGGDGPDPLSTELTHIQKSVMEVRGMLHSLLERGETWIFFRPGKPEPLPAMLNMVTAHYHLKANGLLESLNAFLQYDQPEPAS